MKIRYAILIGVSFLGGALLDHGLHTFDCHKKIKTQSEITGIDSITTEGAVFPIWEGTLENVPPEPDTNYKTYYPYI